MLSEGQLLFHGGLWPGCSNIGSSFVTSRPFSTSFCPQIALSNALHNSKAYNSGEVHLLVLRVANPQTKVFCFRLNGTNKGHEAEILFAAGAKMTLRSKTLIRDGEVFGMCKIYRNVRPKLVPHYLLEVDIS